MKTVMITSSAFTCMLGKRYEARKAIIRNKPRGKPRGTDGCSLATLLMKAMTNGTGIPLLQGHNALLDLSSSQLESERERWKGAARPFREQVDTQFFQSHGKI